MDLKILAMVRGLFPDNNPEGREDARLVLNNRGDLLIAQGMPELAELVRLGDSWQVSSTTGLAALAALPTTTAGLSLNNFEPASGQCYAIDSFGSVEEVVDATQTDVTAIFAMLNKRGSAQATAGTVEAGSTSLSGKAQYGGSAVVRRGATVVNDNWFPHGTPGAQMAAAAAGANWKVNEVSVRGLYLVPPGGTFSIQAVKAAAQAAAQQFFFIRWHEVQIIYKA